MVKYNLFLGMVLVLAAACGRESTIKNAIESENLRAPRTMKIVVPLAEDTIASFNTPIKSVNPFLTGIVAPLMNFGAAIGQGKMRVSLEQPLPEIPTSQLKGIAIKRLFFYMDKTQEDQKALAAEEIKEKEKVERYRLRNEAKENKTEVGKVLHGMGTFFLKAKDSLLETTSDVVGVGKEVVGVRKKSSFRFIDELAVTVRSQRNNNHKSWVPEVTDGSLSDEDKSFMKKILKKKDTELTDKEKERVVLVKYQKSKADQYLRKENAGKVYIIETDQPAVVRREIEKDQYLQTYYSRIHTLNKSLLIELVDDVVVEENFKTIFNERISENVKAIKPCDDDVCKDFKVADVNLVPIMAQGNAMLLDIMLSASEVPASFQLKGFVEFEVTFVPLPE